MDTNLKYSPMIMQYLEVKKNLMDCIVFYRLGDFYEMFFEDAKIGSNELDLVLTGRNAGVEEKVPMCGIPYHAANSYIQRLSNKGYKIAIVEQIGNPEEAKGIVKRDVVKIVTPGTIMDEISDENSNIQIASIYDYGYGLALCICEMLTGKLTGYLIEKDIFVLAKILSVNNVKETILDSKVDNTIVKYIKDTLNILVNIKSNKKLKDNYKVLYGEDDPRIISSLALLTNYLEETQKKEMNHLLHIEIIEENKYLKMDFSSRNNLELTQQLRSNSKSATLFSFMNKCKTAMGSRKLKNWIEYPLINIDEINKRLNAIEYLNDNFILKDELKELLDDVYDLDRICARIAYGNINPKDILRLEKSLKVVPSILDIWNDCKEFKEFNHCSDCSEALKLIDNIISEDAPVSIKEGNIFNEGYDAQLDEYRSISKSGKDFILEIENKERERTGIKSLKVGYNKVFGYYIEISKANLNYISEEFGYIRKQTLANAERFITNELKEKEDAILNSIDRAIRKENELFYALIDSLKESLVELHNLSNTLAMMDALYSLSIISSYNKYIRPEFVENNCIELIEARHPILEQMMDNAYVSNSLIMNDQLNVNIITGPNMGGKSTYMRQCALVIIMAQIGCYIPASSANLPIFDQIFTRIGASDDIMSGQSTFMVEMIEANNAIQNATKNSLLLLDEIGRGTSTFDGMALAQSILEYLNTSVQAKTLFSTHYHELTVLGDENDSVNNLHVEVHEENDHVTFLYKVLQGKADKSYGVNVAKLAHLPEIVLERAKEILDALEIKEQKGIPQSSMLVIEKEDPKLKDIKNILDGANLDDISPKEAWLLVEELKSKLK